MYSKCTGVTSVDFSWTSQWTLQATDEWGEGLKQPKAAQGSVWQSQPVRNMSCPHCSTVLLKKWGLFCPFLGWQEEGELLQGSDLCQLLPIPNPHLHWSTKPARVLRAVGQCRASPDFATPLHRVLWSHYFDACKTLRIFNFQRWMHCLCLKHSRSGLCWERSI